jgi:hypothetical protein
LRALGTLISIRDFATGNFATGNDEGDYEVRATIPIDPRILLLIGKTSARRPAVERSVVAKATVTRKPRVPS